MRVHIYTIYIILIKSDIIYIYIYGVKKKKRQGQHFESVEDEEERDE